MTVKRFTLTRHFDTAVGQDNDLASHSMLCRMGQRAAMQAVAKAHELLRLYFIEQHDEPLKEIVLDFDSIDVPGHGNQPGTFFDAYCWHYYDHYCYLPLRWQVQALLWEILCPGQHGELGQGSAFVPVCRPHLQ